MFAIAWITWGTWAAAVVFGMAATPRPDGVMWGLMYLAPPVFFLARSFFFGIYLEPGQLVIVSWLWTYRIPNDDIDRLLERIYQGYITYWDDGVNLFSSRMRMLGVRRTSGRERFYRGTVMTNRRSKAVLTVLKRELRREVVVVVL